MFFWAAFLGALSDTYIEVSGGKLYEAHYKYHHDPWLDG